MEKWEVKAILDMTNHPWWKVLELEMENEIKELETILLGKAQSSLNKIDYNYYDILRAVRNLLIDLKNKPEEIKNSFIHLLEDDNLNKVI